MRKFAIRLTSTFLFATMIFATVVVAASHLCGDRISEASRIESSYGAAAESFGTPEFGSLNLAADKSATKAINELFFVNPMFVRSFQADISNAKSEAEYVTLSTAFTNKLNSSVRFDIVVIRVIELIVTVLYAGFVALCVLTVKDTVFKRKGVKNGKKCIYNNV